MSVQPLLVQQTVGKVHRITQIRLAWFLMTAADMLDELGH